MVDGPDEKFLARQEAEQRKAALDALRSQDRRKIELGPPPGVSERRRHVTYDNRITLGTIIQTLMIAASVIGSAISAVFASGAYVQHLRDDLMLLQHRAQDLEAAQDEKIIQLLQADIQTKRQ